MGELTTIHAGGDHLVPYPDHALFLALRGAGQGAVMQAIWIYPRAVDLAALSRFHGNLYSGLLGRRIERSPLPFGRHRWVAAPRGEDNFDIAERARSREELFDWADEQVERPLDPEWGPAWRLGVQSFTDGSTAVSLVVSHCIADGTGSVLAALEAMNGVRRDLGYPPPGSRPRGRAVRADLRQVRRELPEIARTAAAAAKVAFRRRNDLARPEPAAPPAAAGDQPVLVPSASVFLDVGDWDARAERLGGNSFSLAAGFAGKLAQNLGRVRAADGIVTLMIPVNEREDLENTGGNVVSIATVSFDPAAVTEDLTGPRSAIREGLRNAREQPDEMVGLLPLIPFVPKRGLAKMVDVAFGFSVDLPVSCSNLGDVPAEIMRVDGTAADYLIFRGVDRSPSRATLDRRGGLLTVASARMAGKIVLTVISYQPGGDNTHGGLRAVIARTLGEFGLTGEVL